MSNVSQSLQVSQSKFEYQLPQDTPRVLLDATISATFTFFHDCIVSRRLSRVEIEAQALLNCKQLEEDTKENPCTNDLELFNQLTVQYYTEAYTEQQKYHDDHPQELEAVKQQIQEIGSHHFLHDVLAPAIEAEFQKRGLL